MPSFGRGRRPRYDAPGNPFAPASLNDDDLAVAACLEKMAAYAAGGAPFYGAREAAWDHCLNLAVNRAVASGETLRAEPPERRGE